MPDKKTTKAAAADKAPEPAENPASSIAPGTVLGQEEQLPAPGISPAADPSWQSGQAVPDPNGTANQRMAALINEQAQIRGEDPQYPLKKKS